MKYYVYGILDPEEAPANFGSLAELLGSIIYVGKGKDDRLVAHTRQAAIILAQEIDSQIRSGDHGRKLNRLLELLRAGKEPRAIKFMAGLESEQDAYIAETFAIESVNAHRLALGREPLTNAVAGHGLAIEPLADYVSRFDVHPGELEPASGSGALALLVKGSSSPAAENQYEPDPAGELPFLGGGDHVRSMRFLQEGEDRPGWDPHLPWDQEQAAERARRYWPIASSHIRQWIDNPDDAPMYLLLAIPDHGRTVIRYMWHLDLKQPWDFYPDFQPPRWGIPIGAPVQDHNLLNAEPQIDGRHALLAVAGGYRQVRIPKE